MGLFSHLFSSPKPQEIDFSLLLNYADGKSLQAYHNADLYHLNQQHRAALLLFDRHRGIYLFDVAEWEYETVKTAKATEAIGGDTKKQRAVSVDNAHRIVERKVAELAPHHQCDVCNFLFLPHITREQYEGLDASLKALLPPSKVIFADDPDETIETKLHDAIAKRETILESHHVLAPIFPQYGLLPDARSSEPKLFTPDQRRYIDAELPEQSLLYGDYGSGKSSLILAKALLLKLQQPKQSIAIAAPNLVAAELMTKRLIEMIDHAEVPVDPADIRITTPYQIAKEHHIKLHKAPPLGPLTVTPKMMRKRFDLADVLFCDDIESMDASYFDYLCHLQAKKFLHATALEGDAFEAPERYGLPQTFRTFNATENSALETLEGNAYMHLMHLVPRILKEAAAHDILIVVPDATFGENLIEELDAFIGLDLELFDMHKTLLNQDMEQLLIVCAGSLQGLQCRHLILVDDGSLDDTQKQLALSRTVNRAYVILHTSE